VADPFHQQCVDATAAILKALALDGIAQNVVTQLLERDAGEDEPKALVTTDGEPIPVSRFTTRSRLVDYGVRVRFSDRVPRGTADQLPRWAAWNDAVIDAFPDRAKAEYPAGVIGCRLVSRASVEGRPGAVELAAGEWLVVYRAVRTST
jgi:hypothetical protein